MFTDVIWPYHHSWTSLIVSRLFHIWPMALIVLLKPTILSLLQMIQVSYCVCNSSSVFSGLSAGRLTIIQTLIAVKPALAWVPNWSTSESKEGEYSCASSRIEVAWIKIIWSNDLTNLSNMENEKEGTQDRPLCGTPVATDLVTDLSWCD